MITTPILLYVDFSLIHPGKVLEVKTIDGVLYGKMLIIQFRWY